MSTSSFPNDGHCSTISSSPPTSLATAVVSTCAAPSSPSLPPSPSSPASSSSHTSSSVRVLPRWTGVETLYSAKWLRLQRVSYLDRSGRSRTWDRYERTTALRTGEADSACVLAILVGSGKEDRLLLVKQYRAGLDKYTIEFPAGLIDEGESPATSALRELKEETGYSGEVISVSPYLVQSVLGVEATRVVVVKVDETREENANPQQCAGDAANIEIIRLPLRNLLQSLYSLCGDDCVLYEGVHNFAFGLSRTAETLLPPSPLLDSEEKGGPSSPRKDV